MVQAFDPLKTVVPIFKGTRKQLGLLGTGFHVQRNDGLRIVTARHVLLDNPLNEGEQYFYMLKVSDTQTSLNSFGEYKYANKFDVAVFKTHEKTKDALAIPFANIKPALNDGVFCYEYSPTRIEARPDGGFHITLEPVAHAGNVMRIYVSTFPQRVPTPSLLLSFPAMKGASGAPVFASREKSFYIAGMVVANQEQDVMPAQVLRSEDGGRVVEEIKYFLPRGVALDAEVLKNILSEMGLKPEVIELPPT